ncbi:LuxR family transcriptional regulator [Actinoplanes sp. NBRC 14428]|nr:LuxR family transcriptional regulator [Actinoplanes sp. NBRC 14428]
MTDRPSPPGLLLGRDAEAAVLRAFATDLTGHGNALIITGDPGVGRTALLGDAVREARAAGVRVIAIAGAEHHRHHQLAGVRGLVSRLCAAGILAPAQRAELDAVLADTAGAASRLSAFVALVEALRREDSDDPLLLAVDDAHHLDDASTEALAFVARRLRGGRTGMLVVTGPGDGPSSAWGRLPAMRLGPLSSTAAGEILAARHPELPPDVREALVEAAEGSPLALLDCAGAVARERPASRDDLPDALPIGERLRDVLAAPLAGFSGAARLLLLLIALEPSLTPQLLQQLTGVCTGDALGPVLSAGLVIMRSGALTIPRPLARSAVVAAATPAQRRHAHALLAEAVGDRIEARARHLALSVDRPDARVAEALQDAAVHALLRDDARAAGAALAGASAMWGDSGRRRRRLAGRTASVRLLTDAILDDKRAARRLSGKLLRAGRAVTAGQLLRARKMLADALEHPEPDAAGDIVDAAVDLLLTICYIAGTAEAWADFRRATRLLGVHGSGAVRLVAQLSGPDADLSPRRLAELDVALDRLASEDDPRAVVHLATAAVAVGRGADCRVPLCRVLHHDTALPRRVLAAALLAVIAVSTGDSVDAERKVEDGLELCRGAGREPYVMLLRSVRAMALANRADPGVGALTGEVLAWATPARAGTLIENARWARAREALSRSDHPAAYREFAALGLDGDAEALLTRRPEMVFDVVEAAVRSGHTDLARACARRARLGLSDRLDLLALGARAVAAPPDGTDRYDVASALGRADRWPFDVARIRLLHGEFLERTGAREEARERLNSVLETFRALRAGPWAARAAAPLRRAGEAVVGSAERVLTRQEATVAELAVSGLTNQQIAERLHISARTVASHLYRIFGKLGVTSRAQLPAVLTAWKPPLESRLSRPGAPRATVGECFTGAMIGP